MATKINFIDIYAPSSDADLRVAEFILEDYDIACTVRATGAASLSGDPAEKRIAVEEDKVDKAREVISDAVRNGMLSEEGSLVD